MWRKTEYDEKCDTLPPNKITCSSNFLERNLTSKLSSIYYYIYIYSHVTIVRSIVVPSLIYHLYTTERERERRWHLFIRLLYKLTKLLMMTTNHSLYWVEWQLFVYCCHCLLHHPTESKYSELSWKMTTWWWILCISLWTWCHGCLWCWIGREIGSGIGCLWLLYLRCDVIPHDEHRMRRRASFFSRSLRRGRSGQ